MNRRRDCAKLVLVGGLLVTLLPLGCSSMVPSERRGLTRQVSTQGTQKSAYASDSATVRWLMRLPDAEPPPTRD